MPSATAAAASPAPASGPASALLDVQDLFVRFPVRGGLLQAEVAGRQIKVQVRGRKVAAVEGEAQVV